MHFLQVTVTSASTSSTQNPYTENTYTENHSCCVLCVFPAYNSSFYFSSTYNLSQKAHTQKNHSNSVLGQCTFLHTIATFTPLALTVHVKKIVPRAFVVTLFICYEISSPQADAWSNRPTTFSLFKPRICQKHIYGSKWKT